MFTEQMKRAGWNDRPSHKVRQEWEKKGGRWQAAKGFYDSPEPWIVDIEIVLPGDTVNDDYRIWRPVSPRTWDYSPDGWGEVMPTEPDVMWWRKDAMVYGLPVNIHRHPIVVGLLCWNAINVNMSGIVEPDGQWIAPCIKPG